MSRPHRRSRAALRREMRTRDAFLARLSEGLSARIDAFDRDPAAALLGLKAFSRELAMITGDREARIPRRAPLDVGLHVESMIEEWRRERGPNAPPGPTLTVEKSGTLVAAVDGDLVSTIVAELVSNAFKYGRGRPIRVLIEGEDELVRLVVEDEGAGFVSTRALGKLFVRGPGTERVRGFGVGLWLTQALAAEHGGALRYAPRSGGGTRAIVTLRR